MPEPFEALRETLLRSGVAPAHVRRYLRELSEHVRDLADEEREAGRSPAEAEAAARARLGGDEALAEAMLDEPFLRSWTGRAPWATLVVGPFLLLILAWILACVGVMILIGHPAHREGLPPPAMWERRLTTAMIYLVQVGGPLLIGAGVALLAARQRSRVIWPVLGCVAIALFGASLSWGIHWPGEDPRDPLGWGFGIGFRGLERFDHQDHFSLALWSQSVPMGAFHLAVAGAVYGMARMRSWGSLLRSP